MSERDLVVVCHLLGFCGYIVPFGSIVAPLILWLWKRNESPSLDEAGRDILSFQLTMSLYYIISLMLCLLTINVVLLIILFVVHIFCMIKAAIRTINKTPYYYPLTIRFLR